MTEPTEPGRPDGVIGRRAVLDLTGFTSPEQLAGITAIERVATAVVPRSLAAAFTAIPAGKIASTVFVPDGTRARLHTGTLMLGGDSLGSPDDALIVTGLLVVTTPVTGELPALIHVTGTVLVPRGSEAAIGRVLEGTGAVVGYRWAQGQEIRAHGGQVTVSGSSLANPVGEPDDVLVLAGQALVAGEVGDIGYRQVLVLGQAAMPQTARERIDPYLTVQGQLGWYASDNPRMLTEETELAAEFLQLQERPVSLIVTDTLRFAADVTPELLREKVADIVLFDDIVAPAALIPTLHYLAAQNYGTIRSEGGSAG